jgi:hypothetical protein
MKNKNKIILDLCGGTGSWSKPYKDAGYDVRLITLPDNDVLNYNPPKNVYGILAAPPCTMFSFARTKAKTPRDLKEGMRCVRACLNIIWKQIEIQQETRKKTLPLKFWALENPYHGLLKKFLGKSVFDFDPFEFGDGYKKRTAIWGNFNEPIKLKKFDIPRSSWSSKKFDRLKSNEIHGEFFGKYDRQTRRAITPAGFANAFFKANQ